MQLELRFLSPLCLSVLFPTMFPLPLHELRVFLSPVILSLENIWSQWSVCKDRKDKQGKPTLLKLPSNNNFNWLFLYIRIYFHLFNSIFELLLNSCTIYCLCLVSDLVQCLKLFLRDSRSECNQLRSEWSYLEYLWEIISVL